MLRHVFLGSAGAILIFLGVGCSESGTQPSHVQLTSSQSDCRVEPNLDARSPAGALQGRLSSLPSSQSPCLDSSRLAKTTVVSSTGGVRFAAGHDTLFVYHDSAWYNCCSKIRYDVEVQDSVVNFIEVDAATSLCHFMCHFNLGSYLWGLSRGTYTARLWTARRDSLLGEAVIFIPGTNQVWFEDHCDTLTVHHDGKVASCCAKFIFGFEQNGNLLSLAEIDTSSIPCRCVCTFDLVAQVSGLTGGLYVVRVQDSTSGILSDSAIVQIAPCLPQ